MNKEPPWKTSISTKTISLPVRIKVRRVFEREILGTAEGREGIRSLTRGCRGERRKVARDWPQWPDKWVDVSVHFFVWAKLRIFPSCVPSHAAIATAAKGIFLAARLKALDRGKILPFAFAANRDKYYRLPILSQFGFVVAGPGCSCKRPD
jgi:hypothetical protein